MVALEQAKILIVDDQQTTREISAVMLSTAGYQVTTCADCVDALQRIATDPQDAVLVNLHMRGMERHEFLRALQDLPLAKQPVNLGMAHKAKAAGVSLQPDLGLQHVIWVPFRGSELRESVKRALLSQGDLPTT
jgi:CheY-like chemotaxis protein